MGPPRRSKIVNKRYSNEESPAKDDKKNQRKKKSDMLGPHWSKDELEYFYEAYRKHGRDWRKVAAVLRNRSADMVEAVYSLNKAYLSLPEGTASVVGFIAMMTDYYSNMEEGDSEQERNDGEGTYRKPQKRMPRKVHETTSRGSAERLHPESVPSDYGFLTILKKKRSGGSGPRVVGKRTPRFPVSHSHENAKEEKYISPTRKDLKLKVDNEEDVAHSIAMTLTEKRVGSPNRRSNSLMSSPSQSAERMYDESHAARGRYADNGVSDDDIEGSMEADNTIFSRHTSKEGTNAGYMLHDQKGSQGRKLRFDKKENKHLDYIREASSGTKGQKLGTLRINLNDEVVGAKPSRPSSQDFKKRSKEAFPRRDERSAFDALETLASLSLMGLPDSNGNELNDSHRPQAMSPIRQGEKRKSAGLIGKGNQSVSRLDAENKAQTSGRDLVDDINAASETESHQLITKVSRKRQKIVAPKISEAEAPFDTTLKESVEAEATHAAGMSMSRRISQTSSPQLVKHVASSIHSRRKGRSKRKMYKPEAFEIARLSDAAGKDKSGVHLPSYGHRTVKHKGKLSNCLSNQLMRRWCAFEWFYSAIDAPWFSKREFVEYLNHVGLGHVPRLTRVEWGVIRSSLGKPRRFSVQFLKEEKDKLNQYRDSVRTHYTELRSGSRDGLPTDLARPLSVGQRVIAIYPRTREIHDGIVLTVDHDRCRIQFDRPELGAEIIMDTDCMPLNPFENLPASLMCRMPIDKFFESLNEVKVNGLNKDLRLESFTKGSTREKSENMDEVASVKTDLQSINGPSGVKSNYAAHSVPGSLIHIQAKEADVEAIAELTRALKKKEAIVFELRRMNDDVLENQTDGDFSLQESDAFKKPYAAVLVQLNEVNVQVSSALFRLRQRNTYQQNFHQNWPKAVGELIDHGVTLSSKDDTANHTEESKSHENEIVEISKTKARSMVDIAIQALSSLRLNPTVEIDKAVDYVNDRIPLDDSYIPPVRSDPIAPNLGHSRSSLYKHLVSTAKAPDSTHIPPLDLNKASVPSELITQCVATLFVIQKCTQRQFPPAEVASILDSAVSSLQPCSPQNLQVYADIQKCMGIIKNQILALVPT